MVTSRTRKSFPVPIEQAGSAAEEDTSRGDPASVPPNPLSRDLASGDDQADHLVTTRCADPPATQGSNLQAYRSGSGHSRSRDRPPGAPRQHCNEFAPVPTASCSPHDLAHRSSLSRHIKRQPRRLIQQYRGPHTTTTGGLPSMWDVASVRR